MKFNPYLLREHDQAIDLYIGGCDTKNALGLFDKKEPLSIISMGATLYKDFGWATELHIRAINTIGDFLNFLESEGEIGIVEFNAHVSNVVKLLFHDDGKFRFTFRSKSDCYSILKHLVPPQYVDMFMSKLLSNQGVCLEFLEGGKVKKYSDFQEYISKNAQ